MWQYNETPDGDYLCHWKYIKKVKKNGKWRYYYDVKDALGFDERHNAAGAIRRYEKAKSDAKEYNKMQSDPTRVKWYKQSRQDQLNKAVRISGKHSSDAIKKYYKTPLGKLDLMDDQIDKGRNFVANLLNKAANVVRAKDEDDFHLKY